jgi:hypothetical protein
MKISRETVIAKLEEWSDSDFYGAHCVWSETNDSPDTFYEFCFKVAARNLQFQQLVGIDIDTSGF